MSYSIRNIYFLTSKCGSVNCGNFLCVFIIFFVFLQCIQMCGCVCVIIKLT